MCASAHDMRLEFNFLTTMCDDQKLGSAATGASRSLAAQLAAPVVTPFDDHAAAFGAFGAVGAVGVCI